MKTALKHLLTLWLLATSLLGYAQYRFKVTLGPDNVQHVWREAVPGTGRFTVPWGTLPPDAIIGRRAGLVKLPYALEPIATNNFSQFGTGKYFDPDFKFTLSWAGYFTPNQRRSWGMNGFEPIWSVKPEHMNQLQAGESLLYWTQNNLGELQDPAVFLSYDLQTFLNKAWGTIPSLGYPGQWSSYNTFIMDLETSVNGNVPGQVNGTALPGFGQGYYQDWNYWKDRPFVLEGSSGTTTLAQLAAQGSGAWDYEMHVRRANRMSLLLEIAKKKGAPGTRVSAGIAAWIGEPMVNAKGTSGAFMDGYCKVNTIGGDNQGNITLTIPPATSWTVKLDGDYFKHEDFLLGYKYELDFYFDNPQDETDIFTTHKTGTQTYPYLWSKIKINHVVANEKGWIQLNRNIIQARTGQSFKQPMVRMMEPVYEFGHHYAPFPELQNIASNYGTFDTPRVWVPPYTQYSIYMVTRFFAGSDPLWGYYLFPIDITKVTSDPALDFDKNGKRPLGHELHPITAIAQARADLQPYEKAWDGSSLVEDPEVQINQTGSFSAYDGIDAYNVNNGVHGTQKPAYMLRYKAVPGGWQVWILGGMKQDWTQERTDIVRVPSGGLAGNQFRVKLRGPSAQVYEFFVKSTDSNQTYDALPTAEPNWEKPAYAGRVSATVSTTVTPPVTVTTTPPVTTTGSLAFNIVSYDCNTGILQYNATSSNTSATINLSIPGVYAGNITNGATYSYTFPSDARTNRSVTGQVTQADATANVNFTTSCSLASGNPSPPPTTPPVTTPPTTTGVGAAMRPGYYDWTPPTETSQTDQFPVFETDNIKAIPALGQQWNGTKTKGLSGSLFKFYNKDEPDFTLITYSYGDADKGGYSASGDNYIIHTGAGMGHSIYLNPRPYYGFSEIGWAPHDPWLGVNAVDGDDGYNTAKVLAYGKQPDNSGWYVKTMPVIYGQYASYWKPMTMEKWFSLSGRTLTMRHRIINNQSATSGYYKLQDYSSDTAQEMPCLYVNADRGKSRVSWYGGTAPCTNAAVKTIDVGSSGTRRINGTHPTERWIAVTGPNNQPGIGLILETADAALGYLGSGDNHPDRLAPNGNSTYINNGQHIIFDNHGTYYSVTKFVAGTIDQIRAVACAVENRFPETPAYRFNTADRQGWSFGTWGEGQVRVHDDEVYAIATAGYWNLFLGKSQYSVVQSPFVAWKASSVPTIYIDMAYTGPNTTWAMTWQRSQQYDKTDASDPEINYRFPDGIVPSGQQVTFTVNNTGTRQIVAIPMSGRSDWKDYIAQIVLRPNYSGNASAEGSLKIYSVSTNSAGLP